MCKLQLFRIFSFILVFFLFFIATPSFSCPRIGLEERFEIKKQKVETCFTKDLRLTIAMDAVINAAQKEDFDYASTKALRIADYLFNLSNNKTKYGTSNFPFISSHFFYKLAQEYLWQKLSHYREHELQSESAQEIINSPNMLHAKRGILETVKKISWQDIDRISSAAGWVVQGKGSLGASLIIVLEQTKNDIFKSDYHLFDN